MNSDHKDRILDAMLEEAVGGHQPPDLTSRILQAWQFEQTRSSQNGASAADGIAGFEPVPPPVVSPNGSPLSAPNAPAVQLSTDDELRVSGKRARLRTGKRQSMSSGAGASWLAIAVAFGFIAIGIGLTAAALRWNKAGDEPTIADSDPPAQPERVETNERRNEQPLPSQPEWQFDLAVEQWRNRRDGDDAFSSQVDDSMNDTESTPHAPPFKLPEPRASDRKTDSEMIAFVNEAIRQAWQENRVTPAAPADDEEWGRRVYERLIGRKPAANEMKSFMARSADDRREQLVDQLLASEEYDRHLAATWSDAMIGATGGRNAPAAAVDEGLEDYLYEAFRADKPFAQVAYELISASGTNNRSAPDYNPAVNFILAGHSDRAVSVTDRTARVFLGKQLHCTQCHDHPANGWQQSDFWALNAFYRQLHVEGDPATQTARLIDRDFAGETGTGKDAEIFFERPDGRLRIAYPRLDGLELPHSGLVDDIHRRYELARLIVTSDDFSQAIVNRVWGMMFGYGFTDPIDDIGPHNRPSHGELLQQLASGFESHQFDIDALTRWIVLSEPFGLSERPLGDNWLDAPEAGGQPLFARYYPQPETAPDIYRDLMIAANSRSNVSSVGGALARRDATTDDRVPLEIIDRDARAAGSFGVAGSTVRAGWFGELARAEITDEQKIEHVFWAVLGRGPNQREMTAARLVLADRMNDELGLSEIWRTLSRGRL